MLLELGSAIVLITIGALAAVVRSYRSGVLARLLGNIDEQNAHVNTQLEEIHDLAEESRDQAMENGERIDDLAETVVLLHRNDDNLNEGELRDRAGVDDLDADLYQGER